MALLIKSNINIAIIASSWHKEIVQNAVISAKKYLLSSTISKAIVEEFEVPGAFEIPLFAKKLAATAKYEAIIACGLVVNGGIYRHDFVASAVIDGLMNIQLTTDVPVFSAVLTPHHFHEHADHMQFYSEHFIKKGEEVAQACLETLFQLGKI